MSPPPFLEFSPFFPLYLESFYRVTNGKFPKLKYYNFSLNAG